MTQSIGRLTFRGMIAACLLMISGVAVSAQGVLDSRLAALLGHERIAIEEISSVRLASLTVPPAPQERAVATTPRGIYDAETLASLPTADGGEQWKCLTEALYFEARGESVRGVFGVGEVILNRVDSGAYPSSVCAVVNQGCQFSYTCDGRPEVIREPAAWERVGKVARILLDGAPRDLTEGATHYHTRAVNPSWARRFEQTATIGAHLFYRQPTRTASNG